MNIKLTLKLILIFILSNLLLTACGKPDKQVTNKATTTKVHEWKMVTTWPKNFPGLGTGANYAAEQITKMSGGRINVKVYGAGELVGGFEVFDAVSQGTAQLGHGAAYYWKGKVPAAQFFAAVPFGLTAQEMNSWIHHGGGMELWEEIYAKHNLIPNAAGNTGVQMGGWFNKEINNVTDLKGLKMRIPGLGGEVLKRVGGTPVSLPGGQIFTALETGVIDATEWVGPYNDLAFGFYKIAKFYYFPGWHEPGTTLETMINKTAFEELPADLQLIVRNALRVANEDMLSEFTAQNNRALKTLINDHGVQLRIYPQAVINKLYQTTEELMQEIATTDAMFAKVYTSFKEFRQQATDWHNISERAYLNTRSDAIANNK